MTLTFEIEWTDGGDVQQREARATWCRLSIAVNGRLVTVLQSPQGATRTSLSVSAYPLAEWLVDNWFTITEFQGAAAHGGAADLSMRQVGDGLAWPDISFSAEGSALRCDWFSNRTPQHDSHPIFLTTGKDYVPLASAVATFTDFIESVIARLLDAGITGTHLENRWSGQANLHEDELQFVKAAAHLGLDPFDTTDDEDAALIEAASAVDHDLLLPFLDSTNFESLPVALRWLREAKGSVQLSESVVPTGLASPDDFERPWEQGYHVAQELRRVMEAPALTLFPIEDFVSATHANESSGGVEAYASTRGGRTGLVFPGHRRKETLRFARARALGYWAIFGQTQSVLPPTRSHTDRASRAFAAELLLPSHDLSSIQQQIKGPWTVALQDGVAERFGVSREVLEWQLRNHSLRER